MKPAAVRGQYVKGIAIKGTMSPARAAFSRRCSAAVNPAAVAAGWQHRRLGCRLADDTDSPADTR